MSSTAPKTLRRSDWANIREACELKDLQDGGSLFTDSVDRLEPLYKSLIMEINSIKSAMRRLKVLNITQRRMISAIIERAFVAHIPTNVDELLNQRPNFFGSEKFFETISNEIAKELEK